MSIIEVAKIAGVSKSTVSRVINHVPGVNADITKAVVAAMQQIGYEPSARRRGPKPASRRGIRTGNILLLILGLQTSEVGRMPVFASLLHGVEAALRDAGLNLVLAGYQQGQSLPAGLSGGQVDGVLLFGTSPHMPAALRARLSDMPIVGLMRQIEGQALPIDRVLYNNTAVGELAAQYLIDRGNKIVASINTVPDHPAFVRRLERFKTAAKEQGVEVYDFASASRFNSSAEEDAANHEMIAAAVEKGVTGVFIPADAHLASFYRSLEAKEITPLEDVDIVSCDNEEQFLTNLPKRPTTIDINPELVGSRGVRQLLWRLANPHQKSRVTVLIEPYLVPGSA